MKKLALLNTTIATVDGIGEIYYYVTDEGYIDFSNDNRWSKDNCRHNSGNYFQT